MKDKQGLILDENSRVLGRIFEAYDGSLPYVAVLSDPSLYMCQFDTYEHAENFIRINNGLPVKENVDNG